MADLLIVTLGPIQDFIAAARRSRDLWFGSWLLSELSKATARGMAEECGFEALVFPGISQPGQLQPTSPTSVANKIVLRVPDGKDAVAVAKRGERAMRDRLHGLRDEAFERISRPFFDLGTACAQVEDLIEYTWVSAPEQGEHGYKSARREAEALMTARKATRLWGKVPWGKDVPKSSIDGERESVLHEDLFDKVGKDGGLTPEQVRVRYGVGPTERLCGVGLLKRHGIRKNSRYSHRFLSTGHLAAWPLHRRARGSTDPELLAAWSRYLEVLDKGGVDLREQEIVQGDGWEHDLFGRYDGSLLFESRLPELFEEVTDPVQRESGLRAAKTALASVLKKLGVSTPLPYYAILHADGDHMGKAIERQDSFQSHQALSRQLDQFAQGVRSTVEGKHAGELIYAGGDDVLAFVPLHRAVRCARQLQEDFRELLSGFPVDKSGATPTLSAGIAISHFMDPLRRALSLARKAEKLAKEKRDSLAIIVDKRSGASVKVTGIWGTLDLKLDDYVAMHLADVVPDGAAYELRELARLLEGAPQLSDLVKSEAKRILRRKQPEHGAQQKLDPKVFDRLAEDIKSLTVGDVADRLIVARLLAQAQEESGEPFPPFVNGDPT